MNMDNKAYLKQLERLTKVKWQQWEKAFEDLLPEISRLLHGILVTGDDGRKYMIGGYVVFGAHSGHTLGGDALYHYQSLIAEKLYDGTYEWKEDLSLSEQLKEIAKPVIDEETDKYRARIREEKKHGYNSTPVSLNVEWVGKEDDYTGEVTQVLAGADSELIMSLTHGSGADKNHLMWETICEAADGDKDLEEFVQVTGECRSLQEVRTRLGLKDGDRDKLIKRLRRKVNKITNNNGTKRNHQRTGR